MTRAFVTTVFVVMALPPGAHAQGAAETLAALAGVTVHVQVATYRGDDPWRAQDLVACPGRPARRFVDLSQAERRQAVRRVGPCAYQEATPPGYGYRATADRHVHADFFKPYGVPPGGTRDFVEKESTRLTIGTNGLHNDRYFQEDLWTGAGPDGEVLSWRDAVYYTRSGDGRAIGMGGCMTRPTPVPGAICDGVQLLLRLAATSPTGFRAVTAVLDCTDAARACALTVTVAAGSVTADVVARPGEPLQVVPRAAP